MLRPKVLRFLYADLNVVHVIVRLRTEESAVSAVAIAAAMGDGVQVTVVEITWLVPPYFPPDDGSSSSAESSDSQ